jgi:HSP20 family protein
METLTRKEENANGVRQTAYAMPQATIRETKEGYVLQAEMPGVNKSGLEVTVESNQLTFVGHRSDPEIQAETVYRESRPRDFRRVFELDPTIDTARIEAKMDQGVLTLTLPKAERVKPKKIVVTD